MANDRLNNFLIEDVKKLVALISEREELQGIATPGTNFDTLEDFANYWGRHITTLSE